jgi:N-acetylglutamate synthase-like GNAT family acetyltransferase
MDIVKNYSIEVVRQKEIIKPTIRRAKHDDIDGIMEVACSVGNSKKIHSTGFLMDDYTQDYNHFKRKFLKLIMEIEHFYVVKSGTVLGFLIAYTREQWLHYNPHWLQDIVWNPAFDRNLSDDFVLVDKTAIMNGMTGRGLGSLLYKTLVPRVTKKGIHSIFAETLISPKPNFASLEFRIKQDYTLAGVRYERYQDAIYTDLIYHKAV